MVGATRLHPHFSFAEYVRIEGMSPEVKHEFDEGEVRAMAGGTPEHAQIAANLTGLLRSALLGRRCGVHSSDLRVHTGAGLVTYPDVTVVCEHRAIDPEDPTHCTITNPTVLVEVLSRNTEDYDRGKKLAAYKATSTVEEIVLVAHDKRRVELWRRERDGWALDLATSGGAVRLQSIGVELAVDEVYADPLSDGPP